MSRINQQMALLSGESTGGKSASLRTIPKEEQSDWLYMNCESGKQLPFAHNFNEVIITDPYQVIEGLQFAADPANGVKGVIVDTLTFLMEMYESLYVHESADGRKAWGEFAQFFKTIMQVHVPTLTMPIFFLAHVREDKDEKTGIVKTSVPIKGALRNVGIEAYFSTVVMAKRVTIKELEKYNSDLLVISDHERELGYKHVFQTQPTKATFGERIRSPMGLFSVSQTYMDNDAMMLLSHLKAYYQG